MKYSTKVSDAVHILSFIHLNPKGDLSSAAIAKSICTNPSYVRMLMAALKRGGILAGTRGAAAPRLTRAPEEVSLLEVYRAMEGEKPLLHLDTHTNPDCGVGVNIQLALKEHYDSIQRATEQKMSEISLADVLKSYHERIGEA